MTDDSTPDKFRRFGGDDSADDKFEKVREEMRKKGMGRIDKEAMGERLGVTESDSDHVAIASGGSDSLVHGATRIEVGRVLTDTADNTTVAVREICDQKVTVVPVTLSGDDYTISGDRETVYWPDDGGRFILR